MSRLRSGGRLRGHAAPIGHEAGADEEDHGEEDGWGEEEVQFHECAAGSATDLRRALFKASLIPKPWSPTRDGAGGAGGAPCQPDQPEPETISSHAEPPAQAAALMGFVEQSGRGGDGAATERGGAAAAATDGSFEEAVAEIEAQLPMPASCGQPFPVGYTNQPAPIRAGFTDHYDHSLVVLAAVYFWRMARIDSFDPDKAATLRRPLGDPAAAGPSHLWPWPSWEPGTVPPDPVPGRRSVTYDLTIVIPWIVQKFAGHKALKLIETGAHLQRLPHTRHGSVWSTDHRACGPTDCTSPSCAPLPFPCFCITLTVATVAPPPELRHNITTAWHPATYDPAERVLTTSVCCELWKEKLLILEYVECR